MKLTRILSLVLVALMLATAFTSCAVVDSVKGLFGFEKETPDADKNAVENLELQLVSTGAPQYVVVYDYKAGAQTKNAVLAMVDAFKEYLNCDIEAKECYSDREVEDDVTQEKEILIGNTNRPESAQLADGMKANDYDIEVSGQKVVIAGGSDAATAKAVSNFLSGFVYEQGDKNEVRKNQKKFSLYVYKNVIVPEDQADPNFAAQDAKAKYDVDHPDFTGRGIYSYNYATMGGARLDSYMLIYPRDGAQSTNSRLFAEELQAYIHKQVGLELSVKKDAAVIRADYKIVIGDTLFSDTAFAETLADNEYYIALTESETELADGTVAKGATLTILFGADAYDAAMAAFQRIMPASTSPIDFNMSLGFVETNMANPPQAE